MSSRPSQRPLPLNSKRLTATLLRQLAVGLELPTAGSLDELRQVIDGRLTELGRDPLNTQVLLQERESGVWVCLQDAGGVFLETEPVSEREVAVKVDWQSLTTPWNRRTRR